MTLSRPQLRLALSATYLLGGCGDSGQARSTFDLSAAGTAPETITVGDLDFGMVGTISSHTATAPVQVNCSSGTPYQISFSGVSPITSYAGTMTNGANAIAYSAALSASGGTGPGMLTIMGLVPPQPTPGSGIYSDNRTVYLNY